MKYQSLKTLRVLGVVLCFILSVAACSDENEPTPVPEPPASEVEVNVVNIDWEKTQLTNYNESSGRMTLHFDGELPQWEEGRSLMVVATERVTAIRRVMKVAGQDGQNVTLETQRASMADLFPGKSIRLAFEEDGQALTAATRTTDGALLPVEVEVMTADGYRTVYDAERGTRADAGDYADLAINQTFFSVRVDTCEMALDSLGDWTPVVEKFLFEMGLYGQFQFDFGTVEKQITPNLTVPVGTLLTCFYMVRGDAALDIRMRQELQREYVRNLDRTLRPRLTPTLRFRFMAGSIPVYIVVDSSLEIEGGLEAAGTIKATYGLQGKMKTGFAVSWAKDNGFKPQLQTTSPFELDFYKPTLEVEGHCEFQASIYPHIDIRFYDFVGVGLEFKPYVANSLKGKAMLELGGEHYASLTDSLSVGMDLESEMSLEFLGVPVYSRPVPEGGVNLFDRLLFAAPAYLEARNPKPETVSGEPIQLDYDVYDFNVLAEGNYVPSSFGLVRFRTDRGTVSTSYAWPLNGQVSVEWTPACGEDHLYAELLDGDGNVMSGDTIKHEDELGLIGYWKMYKYHYAEYAGATADALVYEEWDTEDPNNEFFDLRFEEEGVYYDIDPYDTDSSVGQYWYDEEKLLILDTDTEHPEPLIILQLDNDELVLTTTRDKEEPYSQETFYFKRLQE